MVQDILLHVLELAKKKFWKKDLWKGISHWIVHFMYFTKASNCKFRVPAGFDVGLRASSGFWILVIFGLRADQKSIGPGRVIGLFKTRLTPS